MLHRYELVTAQGISLGIHEFAVSDWKPGHIITLSKSHQLTVVAVEDDRLVVEDLGDAKGVVAQ